VFQDGTVSLAYAGRAISTGLQGTSITRQARTVQLRTIRRIL